MDKNFDLATGVIIRGGNQEASSSGTGGLGYAINEELSLLELEEDEFRSNSNSLSEEIVGVKRKAISLKFLEIKK
jgi:hypothetical protein